MSDQDISTDVVGCGVMLVLAVVIGVTILGGTWIMINIVNDLAWMGG